MSGTQAWLLQVSGYLHMTRNTGNLLQKLFKNLKNSFYTKLNMMPTRQYVHIRIHLKSKKQ